MDFETHREHTDQLTDRHMTPNHDLDREKREQLYDALMSVLMTLSALGLLWLVGAI